jgi:hemerythrin superfamily protein
VPNPNKIMAKAAGAAKAAKAVATGYTGIFRRLEQEHGEVSALMKRVKASKDAIKRRELISEIRRELLAHAKAEELVFYSVLKQYEATNAIINQSLADHRKVEQLLERLSFEPTDDPDFTLSFDELVRSVEDHVHEEEHELFPLARRLLDHDMISALEQSYVMQKKAQMQTLH